MRRIALRATSCARSAANSTRLPAEQAFLPGSPFWDFQVEIAKMGFGPDGLIGMDPAQAARFEGLIVQELAWGDAGLATSAGAGGMPMFMAAMSGQQELIDLCAGKLGCWCATQPDRGSDGLTLYAEERFPGAKGNKGNLQARFVGDEIVINGQARPGCRTARWRRSRWSISLPTMATASGTPRATPLAATPSSRSTSRACPRASRSKSWASGPCRRAKSILTMSGCRAVLRIATRDDYEFKHAQTWAHAGTNLNHLAAGLARAGFELALAYINERKQGGALLSDLQLTQFRLGGIGMKVEAIKAMARHVAMYTKCSPLPHPYFTASGKSFCNTEMLNVLRECMSLFGGNGLTREYPIEKLLRDAQAQQIEDGENNLLQMHYGFLLSRLHRETTFGHA